ncbi:MAG: putative DNA binding domain-containing protein [Chloroflexi bacterium]|nr:putative DNA binding domain-containing protein [Chloroflexota bacterium]MBU1661694.1 putative DNA binding domain-containing protein [Chloroflexota bacterium]
MTPEEIRNIIAHGEGQRLELKRSMAELETGARAVAAMANTDGGHVLFGVRDDGTIIGEEFGAQTKERVVQAITSNTDPMLYPSVEYVQLDGQTVILITVPRSEDRPHLVRGRAYKRVGAADVQMSRAEYERLLLARRKPPFDQQLVEGATYANLGEAQVQDFLRRRQEANPEVTPPGAPLPQVVVEMLEGARERNGELVPTYTGLLFFGRDPQRFLPRAEVKLARFQGTTTLAFIDRSIVHGTLPEMLDGAERFIRRNTRTAMKVVEFESVQVSEYPYDAIREALVNAMAHRDYHHSSGIQVNIFDDRLEVLSPGEALIPLSELEGSHVTRNETLCRRFRDIGEMEQFGTGITKMKRLMREHGLGEPAFKERGSFFKVTFWGPGDHILELIPRAGVTNLRELGLNERQIEALRLMVNEGQELSSKEYRRMFGVATRTASRDLMGLVKTGMVQQLGQGRGIRYKAI